MKRVCVFLLTAGMLPGMLPAAPADDRATDREAVRAHIESIFRAFVNKDRAALRATHDEHWLGFLEGSREIIRGIDGYMDWSTPDPSSPYGMSGYKIRTWI